MKKPVKLLSSALVLSLVLGTLAGCGNASKTPENSSAGTTQSTATAKPADKKANLKFVIWDYNKAPEYKDLIDAFTKENPNITIEPADITAADYTNKTTIMLASGDDSDLIGVKAMPEYSSYVQKKQIIAIDDMIAKDKIDPASYAGMLDGLKLDGKTYALPYRSDFWVLFYNKDLFDKAKVAYPTNDMTWDQFRETAKKLTSGQGNDKVYGAYVHTWKSAVMNWGVADKKGTMVDGKYDFAKQYYQMFLGMQNEDKSILDLATAKTSSASYAGQFESGKVGMCLMGAWFVGTLITDKNAGKHNINWSMVSVPHNPGVQSGTTFGNVTPLAINSNSKNKEETWKFVKFVGSESGAKILAARGVMPAFRSQAVMDVYTSTKGFPAEGKDALKTSSVTIEFPPDKNGGAIDKALQEEHELIMIGKNSVDAGLAAMAKRVADIKAGN